MKGFSVTHILVRISPIKLLSSEHLFGFSYTETVRFGERGVILETVCLGDVKRLTGSEGGKEMRDGKWIRKADSLSPVTLHRLLHLASNIF